MHRALRRPMSMNLPQLLLGAAALAATATAQDDGTAAPTPPPATAAAVAAPTLDELATMVAAAHRTADATTVTDFTADLRIEELERDAQEHRVQFELSVKFLEWQDPDTGRAWPLIRYREAGSARAVEQGRDRRDYWSFADGKLQDMRAREFETDLAHCRRNLKLARQMIQFLDPGQVLRGLQEPTAVGASELRQGRTEAVPCWRVSGRLPAFPLQQHAGDDLPVQATAYVARQDQRLVGLEVHALTAAGVPDGEPGEFLLFADHRVVDGRLVPTRIVHFRVLPDGRRRAVMGIELTTLDLDAGLTVDQFDRPN